MDPIAVAEGQKQMKKLYNLSIDPVNIGAAIHQISSAFGSSSGVTLTPQNRLNASNFNPSYVGASTLLLHQNMSPENLQLGIPPSHLNLPYPQQLRSSIMTPHSSHSRSLSQQSFFSLDGLPPLSPSLYCDPSTTPLLSNSISTNVPKEESVVNPSIPVPLNRDHTFQLGHSVLPRKGHRRSSSDTPLGISGFIPSSPQMVPSATWMDLHNSVSKGERSGFEKPIQLVMKDEAPADCFNAKPLIERKDDVMDDLVSVYMNLDNIDNLNNISAADDSSKTFESSDNEVESRVIGKTNIAHGETSFCLEERREGTKRSSNGDIAPGGRHRRSFSLDSSIGNLNIDDESPKLPPLGNGVDQRQRSPSNSADGKTSEINMDFGNGEFNEVELKKIMESDKLTEIALSDPKRAKRILANRQSAARSKERKVRYISELEHKVQTLQTETTTMSTQFTKLQRDNSELKTENNELKFRLQAVEQQSQLKDALNETLSAEVQRLRLAVTELGGESILAGCMARQRAINLQRFQLQQEQASQLEQSQAQNHHPQNETQTQSHKIQRQPQNDKATAY
ncbi:transcription factor RF2a-like [Senna tora]|uniref:Transcription factor RF2a-like n=1 Tax=Senna tora TaxID=362788 RepID=A0A834TX70_9FABA|nr:transcription factor RF2a-like [Senna tora]